MGSYRFQPFFCVMREGNAVLIIRGDFEGRCDDDVFVLCSRAFHVSHEAIKGTETDK